MFCCIVPHSEAVTQIINGTANLDLPFEVFPPLSLLVLAIRDTPARNLALGAVWLEKSIAPHALYLRAGCHLPHPQPVEPGPSGFDLYPLPDIEIYREIYTHGLIADLALRIEFGLPMTAKDLATVALIANPGQRPPRPITPFTLYRALPPQYRPRLGEALASKSPPPTPPLPGFDFIA